MTTESLKLFEKLLNKADQHEQAAHLTESTLMELFAAEVKAIINRVIEIETSGKYDSIKCSCVGVNVEDCKC